MQETLHQTDDAKTLRQTADAGDPIRQRMQENLHQAADAGVSLSDSRCRRLY